jgi:hypothetical protein
VLLGHANVTAADSWHPVSLSASRQVGIPCRDRPPTPPQQMERKYKKLEAMQRSWRLERDPDRTKLPRLAPIHQQPPATLKPSVASFTQSFPTEPKTCHLREL